MKFYFSLDFFKWLAFDLRDIVNMNRRCKVCDSWYYNPLLHAHTHTHTQTCKHRQTGFSHCSSFVYTLTFSQHLSYVLYTFGKRGPFSNWGPYCSFCYKSPVWMPKQTHTHTWWPMNKLKNIYVSLFRLWGVDYRFSFNTNNMNKAIRMHTTLERPKSKIFRGCECWKTGLHTFAPTRRLHGIYDWFVSTIFLLLCGNHDKAWNLLHKCFSILSSGYLSMARLHASVSQHWTWSHSQWLVCHFRECAAHVPWQCHTLTPKQTAPCQSP